MIFLATCLLSLAVTLLGLLLCHRVLLPALQTAVAWPLFCHQLLRAGLIDALAVVGLWALSCSLAVIVFALLRPGASERAVVRATEYRNEMFRWIRSGIGPEANTLQLAAFHLRQALFYALSALLSANLLSLFMGAILLNYMNDYVAALLRHARRPLLATLLAWPLWSLVRVASFIALGAALAYPLIGCFFDLTPPPEHRTVLLLALCGLVLDFTLKKLLSPLTARLLRHATDLPTRSPGLPPVREGVD